MTLTNEPVPSANDRGILPAQPRRSDLRQFVRVGQSAIVMRFIESREYVDDPGPLTRIPRAPSWLKGLVSVSGVAVPVVDLGRWAVNTGSPDSAEEGRLHILRVGNEISTWSIATAGSPSVVDLDLWTQQPMTHHLPLAVTSQHGKLSQFATRVWTHHTSSALEMDWPRLIEALKQDLASANSLQG